MRKTLTSLLRQILKGLAILILMRHKPKIVGITGTVGKTSAKDAIKAVLGKYKNVRASAKNFNNEIGFPMAIIGGWQNIGGALFWLRVILVGIFRSVFRFKYPEILVLEYGIDRPGDMKYLLSIAKPDIGVITAIGDVPAHVEFYDGPEAVLKEKGKLVGNLSVLNFAVLNNDDEAVVTLKDQTRAHVMTYGFNEQSDVRITNFENRFSEKGEPLGISFKIEHGGSFVPVRINGVLGQSHAYAAAAATCVGLISGLNLVKIAEALEEYEPQPSRMQIIDGIKGSFIIDDSYNASPSSMRLALDTLRESKAKRKVAVLGDMLEIGKYSPEAHEEIGWFAAKVLDILVTVGTRGRLLARAAQDTGMEQKNIRIFDTADEAKLEVQKLIKKGDVILIKASHAMQLDKVVEEIRDFAEEVEE